LHGTLRICRCQNARESVQQQNGGDKKPRSAGFSVEGGRGQGLFTPFYILFFGMMGADVGYGLVLLLATMFVLKVVNLSSQMRKSIKFCLIK